jgi:hypothetical protein
VIPSPFFLLSSGLSVYTDVHKVSLQCMEMIAHAHNGL